jgi:hypothetical protein
MKYFLPVLFLALGCGSDLKKGFDKVQIRDGQQGDIGQQGPQGPQGPQGQQGQQGQQGNAGGAPTDTFVELCHCTPQGRVTIKVTTTQVVANYLQALIDKKDYMGKCLKFANNNQC